MIELQDIKLEDIKKLEISKPYNLIYLDYNKEEGIKIFKQNSNKDIDSLSEEDLKNMYKLYIFNNDSMLTIYNFGDEYKYSRIDKDDIEEVTTKYIYLKEKSKEEYKKKEKAVHERIKVRIGRLKTKSEREVVQYIEYIGGEDNGNEGC
ncbi:hypothetical protein ABF218_05540 [Fusobacterium pseudoperiodonticum]